MLDHRYGFQESNTGTLVGVIELVSFEKDKASWDLEKDEKLKLSTERKDEGNTLFKEGEYERALLRYVVMDCFFPSFVARLVDQDRFEIVSSCTLPSTFLPCVMTCIHVIDEAPAFSLVFHCGAFPSSYDSAIEKFGNNKEPKDEAERALLVPCHLNKAMCLLKLGKTRDAVTACDKVERNTHAHRPPPSIYPYFYLCHSIFHTFTYFVQLVPPRYQFTLKCSINSPSSNSLPATIYFFKKHRGFTLASVRCDLGHSSTCRVVFSLF